jgi:hypothetical protein
LSKQVKYKIQQEVPINIFGIITSESDLKVSWAINKALKLKLSRTDNIMPFENTLNLSTGFANFSFDFDQKHYSLIANKANNTYLFEEFKNLDFLLIIKGELDSNENLQILLNIRNFKEFSSCIELNANLVKRQGKFDLI